MARPYQRKLHDATKCAKITLDARQGIRGTDLLDRPQPRAGGRALDAARGPRDLPRPPPVLRDAALAGSREERPHRAPAADGGRGNHRAAPLQRAARALRVLPDREGPRSSSTRASAPARSTIAGSARSAASL